MGGRDGQFPNRPYVLPCHSGLTILTLYLIFVAALKADDGFRGSALSRAPGTRRRPTDPFPRMLMRRLLFCNVIDRSDTSRYPPREEVPLPTQPPYTAFVGNLPFDLTESELEQHFDPHKVCTCFPNWLPKHGRRTAVHRFPIREHHRNLTSQADAYSSIWNLCTLTSHSTVVVHIAARRRSCG